jgi:hypothetical protein
MLSKVINFIITLKTTYSVKSFGVNKLIAVLEELILMVEIVRVRFKE